YMKTNAYLPANSSISDPDRLFFAALVGVIVTVLIVAITEFFTETAYWPVHLIAKASVTGHATNIIAGQAIGMMATALPVVTIATGILLSDRVGGAGRPGSFRLLYPGAGEGRPPHDVRAGGPARHRGAVPRRHPPVPVRITRDARRRAGGWPGGGGGAAAVPRDQGHPGRHRP